MTKNKSNWLFAGLLTLPMLIFFAGYLFHHDKSLTPSGFIQPDNISYVAYGKQYLDADHPNIFYKNPFADSEKSPAIYFQTQSVFFAALLRLGVPASAILIPFTILCSFLAFLLVIKIFDHLYPNNRFRKISICMWAWGGGLMVIGGLILQQHRDIPGTGFMDKLFMIDPAWGWWGLNWGRALFFSCEAYYHFLFLAVIYSFLKQRWKSAFAFSLILSVSHPFTGIELLSVTAAWLFVEKVFARNKEIPWWSLVAQVMLVAFHAWFYLIHLNQFAEHRSVNEQYSLNWKLGLYSIAAAYALVGLLLLVRWFAVDSPLAIFRTSASRLFLCWFVCTFLLANHELFMKPMQPLHFTRGYVWTGLFLLGLPGLHYILSWWNRNMLSRLFISLFMLFFFLDNGMWIFNLVRKPATVKSTGYLDNEQLSILKEIDKISTNNTLIVSNEEMIPYFATVYTKAYPWLSHKFTAPFVERKTESLKRFIATGVPDSAWMNRQVLLLYNLHDTSFVSGDLLKYTANQPVFQTENYKLVETRFR